MGNHINIYANAAAQRAEKLSWIAVNIGYARSELDEKEPERPPKLSSQLEASFENSIHELSEALAEERAEHEA